MEEERAVAVAEEAKPLSAKAVIARVRLIQEVMRDVMKKDTHYGVIPGCQKPSLWKPGAEQLLVTFRIAPEQPKVEDISTEDSIRYRVTRTGVSNGQIVASGVGECSSDEEKYKWRAPVCDAEFEATPEDRRRLKFKRDGSSYKQVRTNPADVANTILKMADKRAFVAMTLLATAASDIFTQDLEDLPPEVAQSIEGQSEPKEPIKDPQPKKAESANSDEANTVSFVPMNFGSKATKKEGQTRYYCKANGDWMATFDDTLGGMLKMAAEGKKSVTAKYKIEGEYKTITDVEFAA